MIESIRAFFFSVPVDFRLAYSRKRFARWCLVTLEDEAGNRGIGCGTLYKRLPLSAHLYWRSILEPWLEEYAGNEPAKLRADLQSRMVKEAPGVVYAVDTALWDLEAKQKGVAVADLLGGRKREAVPITEQLFINELDDMKLIETMLARGTRSFKVKAGANPDHEIAGIRALREKCGADADIRVDANRGLPFDEAVRMAQALAPLNVTVFEEPTHEVERLADFRRVTGCRVILDETIRDVQVLDRIVKVKGVDAVNIKLARVGGLTGGMDLARRCREHGLDLAVGCAEDLGTGMAANLTLSACLDEVLETEGYGAPRVNVFSLDRGLLPFESPMEAPDGPGFGLSFSEDDERAFREEIKKRGGVVGDGDRLQMGFFIRESWNRAVQGWNTVMHRYGMG